MRASLRGSWHRGPRTHQAAARTSRVPVLINRHREDIKLRQRRRISRQQHHISLRPRLTPLLQILTSLRLRLTPLQPTLTSLPPRLTLLRPRLISPPQPPPTPQQLTPITLRPGLTPPHPTLTSRRRRSTSHQPLITYLRLHRHTSLRALISHRLRRLIVHLRQVI